MKPDEVPTMRPPPPIVSTPSSPAPGRRRKRWPEAVVEVVTVSQNDRRCP